MRLLASIFSPNGSTTGVSPRVESDPSGYQQLYELLWSMYHSDIYADKSIAPLSKYEDLDIHAIRNPTYRTIEFYPKHVWPGDLPKALPIETENERIIEPIHQLWRWSNWASEKQSFARRYALLGTMFLKVAGRDDRRRVFFDPIGPEIVSDFETDKRDNITYIRLDVPVEDVDSRGDTTRRYHVEIWDKETESYRLWRVDRAYKPFAELGTPVEDVPLSAFGIDFVPFVYCKFRDIGEQRGIGAITLSLQKIWEADLIATVLHQRQFHYNKPDWVMTTAGQDNAGRAISSLQTLIDSGQIDENGMPSVSVGSENLWDLPPGRDLRALIANVNYDSALAILQAHIRELEDDLPELTWYRLRDFTQVSGRAVRMLLSDPIANVMEARGNAERMLVKANMMGLSMMRSFGLIPDVGSFDRGDLEHRFEHRDVIPLNDQEIAETDHNQALADAVKVSQLGYSKRFIQEKRGLTEKEITQMESEIETSGDAVGSAILRAFDGGRI